MRNFNRKLQYYQKMEDIDTHAHHDGNEELVQDVKAEGEAEDLDDEDDVPIKRCRLEKKSFNCKVCQKKFSKPETARMHVEVVHMKLYQFQCRLCKKIFIRNSTLCTHFSRLHPKAKKSDILQFRNNEALKYVINTKTGKSLHEPELKLVIVSFEDNEKPDQTNRKLEETHPDPEKCRTENEDPNLPVQKAVQHPGMQKRLDNKSSDSSLLHNQLNSEPEDVFNPFDNEVFSNENFDDIDGDDHDSVDPIHDASEDYFNQEEDTQEAQETSNANEYVDSKESQKIAEASNPAETVNVNSSVVKRNPYLCKLCPLDFRSERAIRSHIDEFHLKIRQYRCLYCGFMFLTRPHLANHCKVVHKKPKKMHFEDNQEALQHFEVAEWIKSVQRFNCNLCDSQFNRYDRLQTHCKIKHGTKAPFVTQPTTQKPSLNFTCKFCNKSLMTIDYAMRHVEIHHLLFHKFNCGLCDKGYVRKMRLIEHCNEEHPDSRVKLIIKSSNFALQYLTTKPQEGNHKTVHQCPNCPLHFYSLASFTKHVKTFHPEIPKEVLDKLDETMKESFICSKCNKGFKSERRLLQHKTRKIPCDEMPWTLEKPEDEFDMELVDSSYRKLEESDPRFGKSFQYACLLCIVCCKSEKTIRHHVKSIHLSEASLVCELCQAKFKTKHALWYHKSQVHNKNTVATCEKCGATFTSNTTLKEHMRSHETEYKYKCDICDKAYRRKDGLRTHKKWAHFATKSLSVACEICGTVVKGKDYLKKHINQVHKNIRRFECHLCPLKLGTNQALQSHIKVVHQKIKEKKCDYCDKLFATNVAKKAHMTNIHWKLKNHECSVCHRMFAARHAMVSHMKTVHGIKATTRTNTRFVPETNEEQNSNDETN